ncbi:hypothetical protein AB0H36_05945 [Kribbella sp. NPDC050820]|uniref:hypothetical protein n=1 Tax=Kribbella sp. NPDC050820 TaxID=3155408 RepID=UPI00340ED96C
MDVGSNEVTAALQNAYSGLLRAVELERRRPDDHLDMQVVVSDVHEVRTLMSALAQMMRSFDLNRYGGRAKWGPGGEPDNPLELTPQQFVEAADADLVAAYEHLQRAADSLTAVRRRLAVLS